MRVPLAELPTLASEILARLPEKKSGATVLFLRGDLGAGKTTFVQALARELGVEAVVQSPTYVLMKSYPLPQGDALGGDSSPAKQRGVASGLQASPFTKLVHIDLYRLENPEELSALTLGNIFSNPSALVAIEWPERAERLLPKPDLVLALSSDGSKENERHYIVSASAV